MVVKLRQRARDVPCRRARADELRFVHCGPSSTRSGVSGVNAMYSNVAMPAFSNGRFAVMAFASSTLVALRMKTTPRLSARPYHCWILPSRWSFTVARTSSGSTFMTSGRGTSLLTINNASTCVVGAGGGGWADAEAADPSRARPSIISRVYNSRIYNSGTGNGGPKSSGGDDNRDEAGAPYRITRREQGPGVYFACARTYSSRNCWTPPSATCRKSLARVSGDD